MTDRVAQQVRQRATAAGTLRILLEHEAIQNEMARQARTDALTGLHNRRAFAEEMTRHLDRLEHERLPGTLLFVDLDNFKVLNDRCGHASGDAGLRLVASLLRKASRPGDLIARLGGDEFAIWYGQMDHLAASERAERLCQDGAAALAGLFRGDGATPALSLSIGIATRWPGSDLDTETLLRQADDAMYAAKRGGKGQWRLWRDEASNDV